jgi:hypothetical protein
MNDNSWQQLLIANHPRLFIRIFRGQPFSPAYPVCPDGWRQVVATVVERVSEAAKGYDVQFSEISERCGRLRIYWKTKSTLTKQIERCIEDAIARAEARAACTCATCGAEGRLYSNSGGRLLPLCYEHARGEPMPTPPLLENVHIVRAFAADEIGTIKCRRYDRRLDAFVDVDDRKSIIEDWPTAKSNSGREAQN